MLKTLDRDRLMASPIRTYPMKRTRDTMAEDSSVDASSQDGKRGCFIANASSTLNGSSHAGSVSPSTNLRDHASYTSVNALLHHNHKMQQHSLDAQSHAATPTSSSERSCPEQQQQQQEEDSVHQNYASMNMILHQLSKERGRVHD